MTNNHQVSPRFNVKLTWQPTPNDNYMVSLQYDGYNIIGRAGVSALLATDALTNREDAPEVVWLGQWRHIFSSQTFAEVKYTGWWGYYDLNPEVNKPGHFDGATGQYSISQGWHYYADRSRDQVNASISHYADKFGKHELKFGAEFEHSKVRNRYGYASNANFPQRRLLLRLRRRAVSGLQLRLRRVGDQQPHERVRAGLLEDRRSADDQSRPASRHDPRIEPDGRSGLQRPTT